jgi:hypothetical protein
VLQLAVPKDVPDQERSVLHGAFHGPSMASALWPRSRGLGRGDVAGLGEGGDGGGCGEVSRSFPLDAAVEAEA